MTSIPLLIIIAVILVILISELWLLNKYCEVLKKELQEKNNDLMKYEASDPEGLYLDEWEESKDTWKNIADVIVSFYDDYHMHPLEKTHPLVTHLISKYKIQERRCNKK